MRLCLKYEIEAALLCLVFQNAVRIPLYSDHAVCPFTFKFNKVTATSLQVTPFQCQQGTLE